MPLMSQSAPSRVNHQHNKQNSPLLLHRLVRLMVCLVFTLAGLLGGTQPAFAQLADFIPAEELITSNQLAIEAGPFPDTPFADPCNPGSFPGCEDPGANITLTYGTSNNIVLEEIIANGNRYEPAADLLPPLGLVPRLEFRRSGPIERQILFFEENNVTLTNLDIAPGIVANLEEAMLSNVINRGIDNVFSNVSTTPQDTGNNIQRIDYIIDGGLTIPANQQEDIGFLILERGGNDNFKIAAITGLEAGAPSAYGPLIDVLGNDDPAGVWGTSNDVTIATTVSRRDDLSDPNLPPPRFRPSHRVPNQPVRGIFFPISSLVEPADPVQPIFGYSLFANDVDGEGAQLVNVANTAVFPDDTPGTNAQGGLDLIAGGFGLIRRIPSDFALTKRITNLTGPANVPDFSVVEGDGANFALLQQEGLGQGVTTIADPPVGPGNEVEYTIYFSNIGAGPAEDVVICDQIPAALTFSPDTFGAGEGIEAIESSSPAGPRVTYTNDDDGDPGTFFQPGEALPTACGADQGNGAVVVNVGDVDSNEVGLVTFRATVN